MTLNSPFDIAAALSPKAVANRVPCLSFFLL
jgi:hypothetical protein